VLYWWIRDDGPVVDMAGLGGRVRERRRALGLSQEDLAGAGVSASYVSLIESGKRAPTEPTLRHLAERLRCSIEYLRDGIDSQVRDAQALEVAWVELAHRHGSQDEVLRRTEALLADPALDAGLARRLRRAQAGAYEATGQLEAAIAVLEELQASEPPGSALLPIQIALARCYREVGDINRSIDLTQTGLDASEALGLDGTDEHAELAAALVASYYERGDLVHAAWLAKQLISKVARTGSHRAQAAAYWNASIVAYEQGKPTDALIYVDRALAFLAEADQRRNMARLRLLYATLLLRVEPPEPTLARELITDLLPELREAGSVVDLAYADTELARAALQLGDIDRSITLAEAALHRLGDAPRLETAQTLLVLAQALQAADDLPAAAVKARQAAQLLGLTTTGRSVAAAWNQLADLLVRLGEEGEAVLAYRRALEALGVAAAATRSATAQQP
jgi:transcriptional regulator with XRE-family HTH domain